MTDIIQPVAVAVDVELGMEYVDVDNSVELTISNFLFSSLVWRSKGVSAAAKKALLWGGCLAFVLPIPTLQIAIAYLVPRTSVYIAPGSYVALPLRRALIKSAIIWSIVHFVADFLYLGSILSYAGAFAHLFWMFVLIPIILLLVTSVIIFSIALMIGITALLILCFPVILVAPMYVLFIYAAILILIIVYVLIELVLVIWAVFGTVFFLFPFLFAVCTYWIAALGMVLMGISKSETTVGELRRGQIVNAPVVTEEIRLQRATDRAAREQARREALAERERIQAERRAAALQRQEAHYEQQRQRQEARLARMSPQRAQIARYHAQVRQRHNEAARAVASGGKAGRFILFNDLKIESTSIGSGSFKNVYKGTYNGLPVAILKVRSGEKLIEKEEGVLLKLSTHPYLISYFGKTEDPKDKCQLFVMELASHGSVDNYMRDNEGKLSTLHQLAMAYQVAEGMVAVAGNGIIHRDLAARNVLITRADLEVEGAIKVGVTDFGLSKIQNDGEMSYYGKVEGTESTKDPIPIRWVPPEVLRKAKWSEKSDVWAYGVFLWEIFTYCDIPYGMMENSEVQKYVLDGKRLEHPKDIQTASFECPDVVYSLMLECWDSDPAKRPNFKQIVQKFEAIVAQMNPKMRRVHLAGSGYLPSKEGDSDEPECVICMDGAASVTLAPCGHQCICELCADQLMASGGNCPICRQKVASLVRRVYQVD